MSTSFSQLSQVQSEAIQSVLQAELLQTPQQCWQQCVDLLRNWKADPESYRQAWNICFSSWKPDEQGPAPMWFPEQNQFGTTNVDRWSGELGIDPLAFHHWSADCRTDFWQQAVDRLQIRFAESGEKIAENLDDVEHTNWFPEWRLNIAETCFARDDKELAIISQQPGGELQKTTLGELHQMANRVSNGLVAAGFQPGDALAVVLPMTSLSVAIYLGVVQAGCRIVSIADSFAPPEIATRLCVSQARAVFTYDFQVRAGRKLPLFERVAMASDIPAIVIGFESQTPAIPLRSQDLTWEQFLVDQSEFAPVIGVASDIINVLFSSGTTGVPKAIPWNQLTPIKCAIDGYCHQDIRPGDVCMWPTNLGWMMGPWLIFASLINRATIALYEDAPVGPGFGKFVQDAGVTMLGVVPTIVKSWRNSRDMEAFDWSQIRVFSSTGESSQRDDMLYLSSLAQIKPVVEYCGGTEIGGGYITSLLTMPNVPAAFNTPGVGLDFVILDANHQPADQGELFLLPPSVGLSSQLLNRDHHLTYFEGVPQAGQRVLRRHGDHFCRLPSSVVGQSVWTAGGRVDDTMNLGGIKTSSAEIERVINQVSGVHETAAIALDTDGGPSRLVIFVVLQPGFDAELGELQQNMNQLLKTQLNPLFRVDRTLVTDALPRTASGKVMRRELRSKLTSG